LTGARFGILFTDDEEEEAEEEGTGARKVEVEEEEEAEGWSGGRVEVELGWYFDCKPVEEVVVAVEVRCVVEFASLKEGGC